MCIGIFAFNHPGYALILASNRDEVLSRATAPTTFHSFNVEGVDKGIVLSGVDLQAGGSWLGVNKYGEVAMLTNISSDEVAKDVLSRGDLVRNFLVRPRAHGMEAVVDQYIQSDAMYAGFNLLLLAPFKSSSSPSRTVGDSASKPDKASESVNGRTAKYRYRKALLTNNGTKGQIVAASTQNELASLARSEDRDVNKDAVEEIGAISNASGLGSAVCPDWPKICEGKQLIRSILKESETEGENEDALVRKLMGMLRWTAPQQMKVRADLKSTIQVQPFDLAGKFYGTRLSTVLLVRDDGSVRWIERDVFKLREDKVIEGSNDDMREFTFGIIS